jgi:hypothetical protein
MNGIIKENLGKREIKKKMKKKNVECDANL